MLSKTQIPLACAATLAGAFLLPSAAHAQVPCADVVAPNKIFGAGGSAVTATLRRIAVTIANDTTGDPAERTTIFYADPNACDGYADFVAGSTVRQFKYWVAGDLATASTTDRTCDAPITGQALDFGHMGNAADLCPNPEVPEGIGDFKAPVQTVNIVTGLDSPETSISAEALYILYGFGPALANAAPWSEGTGVFARQTTAFVTYLVGAHANLDANAFVGAGKWATTNAANAVAPEKSAIQTNGAVINAIKAYATSETLAAQALGYVSGSTADQRRGDAKTLAFQAFDQACGVYPDSTDTALDKLNVRKGKYALWAQGHYFAPVDEDGVPTNPRVANLIKWFSGEAASGTSVSPFDETIRAGDIPECAMEVLREGTTGAFYSFAPPKPCTGRFEFIATGATEHAECEADAECTDADSPKCNYGFCEAYRDEGQEEG
jgi:hypothetical protein